MSRRRGLRSAAMRTVRRSSGTTIRRGGLCETEILLQWCSRALILGSVLAVGEPAPSVLWCTDVSSTAATTSISVSLAHVAFLSSALIFEKPCELDVQTRAGLE